MMRKTAKKVDYITKDKKAEKGKIIKKVKRGPEARYVNITEYKPRKIKGSVAV